MNRQQHSMRTTDAHETSDADLPTLVLGALGSPAPAPALDGSLTLDGSLALARHADESESLSVTHGCHSEMGRVTGLHIRGDLLLGHTPASRADEACAFLAVAGGASHSAPPALLVDGAIQSPPRADMLFVLRGVASAAMFVLWSGHLLGEGSLRLHEGAVASLPGRLTRGGHGGAIGAFLGPNLTLEPFGCDAVERTHLNHRLPVEAEFGSIEFDMGVVLQQTALRFRVGARDWSGRSSDRLVCHGTLHLGKSSIRISKSGAGTSDVRAGDEFILIEAGSICGEISKVEYPKLPPGLRFELERTSTTVSVRVVTT